MTAFLAAGWIAAVGVLAGPSAAPAPLTNEDVVRLVVYGTPEKTILREIESRPVDFDLSPGVVEELARVGVSPALIEAMRRRQAQMPRREDATPPRAGDPDPSQKDDSLPAPAPTPAGRLLLAFDQSAEREGRTPDQILAISSLPKGAPKPDDAEIGTVSDLALAILCTTGDHVPDHWDMHTLLEGAPRHEVLLFRPGSTPGRHKGFDVISLNREPAGPLAIPAGVHALLLGLAGKQTGSGVWRLLAVAPIRVDVKPGDTIRLVLDARTALGGSRMLGFRFNQVWAVRLDPGPPASGSTP